jgi:prepilin-type N-terminal cleavage/methylation domain-containing protein
MRILSCTFFYDSNEPKSVFLPAFYPDSQRLKNTSRADEGRQGFTLVEVIVSVAVTIIVAVGTLSYQYYGVKHDRSAQAQFTAARISQLILEDWKSNGGDTAYDPTTLGLGFMKPEPAEYGTCLFTLDRQTFYIQLTRNQIDYDSVAGVALIQISVTTRWRKDFTRGGLVSSDPTIVMTTYARPED